MLHSNPNLHNLDVRHRRHALPEPTRRAVEGWMQDVTTEGDFMRRAELVSAVKRKYTDGSISTLPAAALRSLERELLQLTRGEHETQTDIRSDRRERNGACETGTPAEHNGAGA